MQRAFKLAAVAASALILSACTTSQMGTKQGIGTLAGAVGGGFLGSQIGGGTGKTIAIIGGTLLGGFVGGEIGASLDRADRLALEENTQRVVQSDFPVGQPIVWNNPNNGNRVVVRSTREGRMPVQWDDGYGRQVQRQAHCREYQQTITVGGRTEQAYGTACQMPDGSWQIKNAG